METSSTSSTQDDIKFSSTRDDTTKKEVDLLILGAGWISQFLVRILDEQNITFAKTNRTVSPGSIVFDFDPESTDTKPFDNLPTSRTVLVVFPIKVSGGSARLVELYCKTHPNSNPLFIQLGSSGIWTHSNSIWIDRHSKHDPTNVRAIAEQELLALNGEFVSCTVLNLAGLWGADRSFRNWIDRVAPTKSALKLKKSVHAIHGLDVARSILMVHKNPHVAAGQRWLITDGRVYDWWDLASAWAPLKGHNTRIHAIWVLELMQEMHVRALPRSPENLDRALDSQNFWITFQILPEYPRID